VSRFPYACDIAAGVRQVAALGEVDQDEHVAERVGDDDHDADGDVERTGHDPAAGVGDGLGGPRRGRHEPVRLVALSEGQHDLRVRLRHPQAGLSAVVVAPHQVVPEGVPVEPQALIEVGHRHRDGVDLAEERVVGPPPSLPGGRQRADVYDCS